MFNLDQIQNHLRDPGVTMQDLIRYVQNPTGQVPSVLALAELKRRQETDTAKNMPQAGGLPTVAQQTIAQVKPQGIQTVDPRLAQQNVAMLNQPEDRSAGISDLPLPDHMYQEKSMAAGGIVAFSGQDGVSDVASKKYQAWQEDAVGPGYLYAGAKDVLGAPFQYGWTIDPITGKLVRKKDVEGFTPNLDAYTKASTTRKQELLDSIAAAKAPQNNMPTNTKVDNTLSNEDISNIYASTKPANVPVPKAKAPVNDVATQQAPAQNVNTPVTAPTGINSLLENTDNVAEDKMARYQEMMGTNPERTRLQDLITKYETGAGEQERMAPWMALTKAGFTMMGGKSPYAMQNISEGAVAGLSDYAQAKDRLDKLNEKQIDIRSKLLQVDEARKSAAVTYGVNSEEHALARNAQVKLKDMEEQNANARSDAQNVAHIKGAQIAAAKKSDYEEYLDYAKQDPDNYKIGKDKDGNPQKVFDATKVTQAFKSWSGTSSSATDKELMDIWNQKSFDKKFLAQYPTPADFVSGYRQKMSLGNTGTPTINAAPANRKPLGSILGQ
jgi:hypothetical protein